MDFLLLTDVSELIGRKENRREKWVGKRPHMAIIWPIDPARTSLSQPPRPAVIVQQFYMQVTIEMGLQYLSSIM